MRIFEKNGKRIIICGNGATINMNGGNMFVNGEEVDFGNSQQVMILVMGNAGTIRTTNGDVAVLNNVNGSISTASGNVKANIISGNASTMSGNIRARKVYGSASTMSGDIFNAEDKGFDYEATAETIREEVRKITNQKWIE